MQTTEIINGVIYEFYYLKGMVMEVQSRSETSISSTGGNYNNPVNIKSTTTVTNTIFLKDSTGTEHEIRLTNWNFACRRDNILALVWVMPQGAKWGPYVAVKNLSTNKVAYNERELKKVSRYGFGAISLILSLPLVLAILISVGSWKNETRDCCGIEIVVAIVVILGIAAILQKTMYKSSEYKKIKTVVNNILSESD